MNLDWHSLDNLVTARLTTARPAVFDTITTNNASSNGTIDGINGTHPESHLVKIANKTFITIGGWIFDKNLMQSPDAIFVKLLGSDGIDRYMTTILRPREDLAAHFKNHDIIESGYYAAFSGQDIPPGRYKILLVSITKNTATTCDPNIEIEL